MAKSTKDDETAARVAAAADVVDKVLEAAEVAPQVREAAEVAPQVREAGEVAGAVQAAARAVEDAVKREPIMQFFAYAHLAEALQVVSRPFASIANQIVENVPRNAERTVALRKLLEAKDAALRAVEAK